MHHRLLPREHRFTYNIFMFYINLNDLDFLHKRHFLFSRNKFNWFNFRDSDHLQFALNDNATKASVKENIVQYLKSQNIPWQNGTIMLLTNVATLGYVFNPISIYFCFDEQNNPICCVAEVCNTHHEIKLYLLNNQSLENDTFSRAISKYFYVSPFSALDSSFNFIFKIPKNNLHVRVDDYQNGKRFLLSALTGKRKKLNDWNLLWYGLIFPLITLKIIFLIHWQAVILYFKGIPFHKKNINLHMQRDLYSTKKM
jgi:DUF1365 family protein